MENFINGKWTKPQSGNYGNVSNPVTGEVFDKVPHSNLDDVNAVMEAAHEAFKKWKKVPVAERALLQHKGAQLMRDHADELGNLLANELGRPLDACIREITRSADLTDYYAEEGLRLKGEIPLHNIEGERVMVIREPIGVVISITSFNYPIALLTMKLGAALIAGCTIVSKPSDETPLSTMRLAELFSKAGYPPGVFNVITGRGRDIGDAMVTHKYTSKIAFTGGTSTGQRIGALAAQLGKRFTLELGGQSPVIVCADANLDIAVPAIVKHTFANSGQFCYRVSRIYVHQDIYDEYVARMTEETKKLTVGNQFSGCDMGPIISQKIYKTSEEQTADAKAKGATITTGGERLKGAEFEKGWFFPPTIIADANHSMEIMREETFGPVAAIMKFKTNEEAIALANDSDYGLAAYVFTGELGTGLRIAEELEAGSVWVNNIQRSYHDVPFGGVKQSGVGREKGRYGIESYTELKTIYYSY
ncbi:succinate-semialdehyde dehydrogenase/glutarate-semialdehyde dehydrogenase [Flavobacterium sp. PL11]|uniref:aldehyde dehydrogenase family protein n=1 Tax=Flavobacterium sp. PL11 TaxID=3071717 RepID=UPI002E094275|nr:succinate-semialdehyde dehydrogenase/glutarate-semialdehyde dehydrogenase [Flavobacterium sp. PL11]